MPNHFHWLVRVKETILEIDKATLLVKPGIIIFESGGALGESYDDFESSYDSPNAPPDSKIRRYRTLNQSIAILLRSYTRAINKQEHRSGSLFRAHTKAQNGWIDEFITINRYRTGKCDFRAFPDDEYGFHCFEYIHNNPAEAGLCQLPEDWEFSSARDYKGLRKGTLCNQEAAKQLLMLPGY